MNLDASKRCFIVTLLWYFELGSLIKTVTILIAIVPHKGHKSMQLFIPTRGRSRGSALIFKGVEYHLFLFYGLCFICVPNCIHLYKVVNIYYFFTIIFCVFTLRCMRKWTCTVGALKTVQKWRLEQWTCNIIHERHIGNLVEVTSHTSHWGPGDWMSLHRTDAHVG